MRKTYKILAAMTLLFVITLNIVGCGSNYNAGNGSTEMSMDKADYDLNNSMASSENASFGESVEFVVGKNKGESGKASNITENKIIVYETFELETLKFDEVKNTLLDKVNIHGGYVQSSNITGKRINQRGNDNRVANLILRIPKENIDDFKNDVNKLDCNITNENTSTEDVTMQYFDKEAHLKTLKIQEERLLELLKKSGELKDVLEVEKELQNVRYEIERLTGTLKRLDNLIDYSTITIKIFEVHKISEKKEIPRTLGERIVNSFKNSIVNLGELFKGLLVGLAAAIPFIIVFGIIAFVLFKIFRNKINKK